jgi:toxin ParE1/3/4
MEKKYKLRQEALGDLKEIGRYTLKKHGREQRNKYLLGINLQFESLAEMPLKGRQRSEIKEGYYSFDYEKHVIFYLIHTDDIEILGILHKRMLPEIHLTI